MPFYELLKKRATRPPALAAPPTPLPGAPVAGDGGTKEGTQSATHSYQARA